MRSLAKLMLTAFGVAVIAFSLQPAADAGASETLPLAGSSVPTAAFANCVAGLAAEGGSDPRPIGCFATRAQAISAALGVPRFAAMSDRDAQNAAETYDPAAANTASFLISTDYTGIGATGDAYYWYTTGPCTTSTTWLRGSMPSGWNDKFQSNVVWGHSDCGHNMHYENNNFNQPPYPNGASIDCGYNLGSCYSMSAMNKKTSSEKWSY